MEENEDTRQKVIVKLNSGNYRGRLNGSVASLVNGRRPRMYQVELLDHPSLKRVHVRESQLIRIPPGKE